MEKFWKRQKFFEIQLNERGQNLFLLNLCFASSRIELFHSLIFMLKFNKNSNLFQVLIFNIHYSEWIDKAEINESIHF